MEFPEQNMLEWEEREKICLMALKKKKKIDYTFLPSIILFDPGEISSITDPVPVLRL